MNTEPVAWFIVRAMKAGESGQVSLYEGPGRDQAQAARDTARRTPGLYGVRVLETARYPPPERSTLCQCKNAPARQALCPFGHPTECHYAQTCDLALCYHHALIEVAQLAAFLPGSRSALPDPYDQRARLREAGPRPVAFQLVTIDHPAAPPLAPAEQLASWLAQGIRDDDVIFNGPGTVCSRCRSALDPRAAVRAWPDGFVGGRELRFHPSCIGLPG